MKKKLALVKPKKKAVTRAPRKTKMKTPQKMPKQTAPKLPAHLVSVDLPPLYLLNRGSVTVRAKQPFVDWLNQLPDTSPEDECTLEEVNTQPGLFLLPTYQTDEEGEELVWSIKPALAFKMCDLWCTNPDWWPTFTDDQVDDWFSFHLAAFVWDLVADKVERSLA